MKVLTWNIFLEDINIHDRIKKIAEIISDIDVICFQEVRDNILDLLIELMVNKGYHLPESHLQKRRIINYRYSTLTFVKSCYTDAKINVIPFKTTYMDRDILELIVNDASIYNVHLESMNSKQFSEARELQLKTLISMVKLKRSICCGDFNIKHSITDVNELKTENTYFASRFSDKDNSERYDRVIFNENIKCDIVSCLGNDKYDFGYCSDHNGIIFMCQ